MNSMHKINKQTLDEFISIFGNIFEHSEWIMESTYNQKPFKDFEDLRSKMIYIFESTSEEVQLKILNSHPNLVNKAKVENLLSSNSKYEQMKAGLDHCSKDEFNEFKRLNKKYKEKFGFPFILAVKNKNRSEILSIFKKRILYDVSVEFNEAKIQVQKIANLRLDALIEKYEE